MLIIPLGRKVFLRRSSTTIAFIPPVGQKIAQYGNDIQAVPKRSFFASSTDHTTLLNNAEIHRFDDTPNQGIHQYVMAASGMDINQVQTVPQLHLARIYRNENTIYGAKVINRALGNPSNVCGRLVDAAKQDATAQPQQQQGQQVMAKSNLHGLADWISKGLVDLEKNKDGGGTMIKILKDMKTTELEAMQRLIASKSLPQEIPTDLYGECEMSLEALAQEYINQGLAEEASLYQSKGGKLLEINHLSDSSEFATSSCGVMATFSLD